MWRRKSKPNWKCASSPRNPLGVDVIELPVLFALQAQGIKVVDGQQFMHQVRKIKTQDEITLLNTACMMVDSAYEELYRFMRPGVRENECVGVVSKVLYDLGSEHVEGVNAISGERCSPHPHVYTDRVLRPGDPAFFDILHSYNGYRTCYYRTFAIGSASPAMVDAYKRCRDYMDAAISIVKPGITTADVVKLWPKAEEFGFANEEAAFALQYGHGVGLSIWEKPIFSRLVSLDHPEVIEEGMVFALETYWPASDGWSAARLEEEVVVTKDGCEVITRFPSEKLLVAGTHYFTAGGPLPTTTGSAVESEQSRIAGESKTLGVKNFGFESLLKKGPECFENLSMNGKSSMIKFSSIRPEHRRRTPRAARYQITSMRIYPKVVTPECFNRGSSQSPPGFPLTACGNDCVEIHHYPACYRELGDSKRLKER